MGMDELVDAFVDGEEPARAEQHQGHDEAPEVPLAPKTERVFRRGRAPGPAAAEEEQPLVPRVGEGMHAFGEESGRAGDGGADELDRGDAEVGDEGGNDRLAAALVHRRRLTYVGLLEGRVALVTGGGRGLGRGISELLASEGATVAVNYRRDADAAAEAVAAIEAAGGHAKAYAASVDDVEQDTAMVEAIVGDLGYIDVLVCNAGIASRGNDVVDTDPAELQRVLASHALSAHHLCRLVLPSMRTRPRGDVVMISSVATSHFQGGGAPYNMAKAALEALAYTLAKEEMRHGIHVNVVAPGLVESEMGRRLAK